MDETQSMEEVQKKPGIHLGIYFSSGQIGHRSYSGAGMLSAAAYSAAPVLRTAATTEVTEGSSDGRCGGAVVLQR